MPQKWCQCLIFVYSHIFGCNMRYLLTSNLWWYLFLYILTSSFLTYNWNTFFYWGGWRKGEDYCWKVCFPLKKPTCPTLALKDTQILQVESREEMCTDWTQPPGKYMCLCSLSVGVRYICCLLEDRMIPSLTKHHH